MTYQDLINEDTKIQTGILRKVQSAYNEMIDAASKFKEIQDFYHGSIDARLVSPNILQKRFNFPKIHLIKTAVIEEVDKQIESHITNNNYQLYILGPMGIGKSHDLLWKALSLRKNTSNIVIYINNPQEWRFNQYDYIIKEIIYALIPFREKFKYPPDLPDGLLEREDDLLKWYYVVSHIQSSHNIGIDNMRTIMESLFNELKDRIRRFASAFDNDKTIIVVSDQENFFRDPINKEDGSGNRFPFNLRLNLAKIVILSVSANNDNIELSNRYSVINVYQRFTGIYVNLFN